MSIERRPGRRDRGRPGSGHHHRPGPDRQPSGPALTGNGPSAVTERATHRVVVIGGGFGGLFALRVLRRGPVDVTVIDRTNHHLFQPLLYQVATGILSSGEIAPPIREIVRHQPRTSVVLGEVTMIDLAARTVIAHQGESPRAIPYDSLIVAAGAQTSYFGHDELSRWAPGMKTIDDAARAARSDLRRIRDG